jgi:ABC-type amino acid transport substrate-binding protein
MRRRGFAWLVALLGVTFALLLSSTGDAIAQQSALERVKKDKVLRVGWATWHPYVYRDPGSNKLTGFSVDLIEDLGKALDTRVEWIEDSWATMPAGMQAGKFDMAILMAITPPRAEVVSFSEPVTKHGVSLLVAKDSLKGAKSWKDFDKVGTKISVTLGSNTDMFVTQTFKQAEIVRLKTTPECLLALNTGRVQALASTIDSLLIYAKEYPALGVVPGDFGQSEVAFALPKGDQQMVQIVNDFVRKEKKNARIAQLLQKYGWDNSFAAD